MPSNTEMLRVSITGRTHRSRPDLPAGRGRWRAYAIALALVLGGLTIAGTAFGGGDGGEQAAAVPNGEALYDRCRACHAVERNRTGPRHCGLAGRKAGSVAGFEYSEAMVASGIVWGRATLDAFLAAPLEYLPETTMGYDGVKDPAERAALIDWLLALGPCP